ncbi:MAG TPA: hypothetical protein VKE69_10700 [Planctomycetota bacterium]|nr:hypothetical protein [Planctomycetota bacterium]
MWNDVHVHLALVHLPIAGLGLALVYLLLGEVLRTPWLVRGGALLLVLAAAGAGMAFKTGEPAEDELGKQAAKAEAAFGDATERVHEHEEQAKIALWLAIGAGVGGLVVLVTSGKVAPGAKLGGPRWLRIATLLVAGAAMYQVGRTANLGGEIRHTEIRAVPAGPAPR